MKATLEFELPEEREEFSLAQRGADWKYAMADFVSWVRSQLKHADLSVEELKTMDVVWNKVWEVLKERELNLWDNLWD